jgi:hypothetical protein
MIRIFRLTNEPGGLGLSCTPAGLALAGVPLLHKTEAGFAPRPAPEIASLLRAAYGADGDPTRLRSRLGAIALALNSGDIALAAIAAVHTETPELSREAATRLTKTDEELTKYNPDEPRDWHGRWTGGGSAGPASLAAPHIGSDQRAEPHVFEPRQHVAANASPSTAATLSDAEADDASGMPEDGDGAHEPTSLEQTFEKKYDDLGPVDFSKEVIQFGYWLERTGRDLSPAEMAYALAEYSFLQDRLSFWLNYDYKPPRALGNLLSAALTLYQGAVNGGLVRLGHLPESMLAVAGTASLFSGGAPRRIRPSEEPVFEAAPATSAQAPKEVEGLGGTVSISQAGIVWGKGIKEQGKTGWQPYVASQIRGATSLPEASKTFDHFNEFTGEAISDKTMNTLTVARIKNPPSIYRKLKVYIDAAKDYDEPRVDTDAPPAKITSRTLQLAVPEYTSARQWLYLNLGIAYGRRHGVSVVITRIRE